MAANAFCMARSAMPAFIFSLANSAASLRMRSAPSVASVKLWLAPGSASSSSSAKSARIVSSSTTFFACVAPIAASAAASAAFGPSASAQVWNSISVSSRDPSAFSTGIRKVSFSGPTSSRHGRSSACGWKPSSHCICEPGPIATRSAPVSFILRGARRGAGWYRLSWCLLLQILSFSPCGEGASKGG